MSASPDPLRQPELDARRRGARRTALWVAAIAVVIYAGFLVSGVLLK